MNFERHVGTLYNEGPPHTPETPINAMTAVSGAGTKQKLNMNPLRWSGETKKDHPPYRNCRSARVSAGTSSGHES